MVVPLDQTREPSTPDCSEKIRNHPGKKKTGSIGAGGKAESRDDIPFSYAGMTRVRFRGFLSGYPATPNGRVKAYPENPQVSRRRAGSKRFLHLVTDGVFRSSEDGVEAGVARAAGLRYRIVVRTARRDPPSSPLTPSLEFNRAPGSGLV